MEQRSSSLAQASSPGAKTLRPAWVWSLPHQPSAKLAVPAVWKFPVRWFVWLIFFQGEVCGSNGCGSLPAKKGPDDFSKSRCATRERVRQVRRRRPSKPRDFVDASAHRSSALASRVSRPSALAQFPERPDKEKKTFCFFKTDDRVSQIRAPRKNLRKVPSSPAASEERKRTKNRP